MPGPAPKKASERRRTNKPVTEWKNAPTGGWRFDLPEFPYDLPANLEPTWNLWFGSWWAAWWELEDVPQIALALDLLNESKKDPKVTAQFRGLADSLGLTPKGRFALRWLPPADEEEAATEPGEVRRLRVADTA